MFSVWVISVQLTAMLKFREEAPKIKWEGYEIKSELNTLFLPGQNKG